MGSYVPKTTQQSDVLLDSKVLTPVEVDVAALLEGESLDALFAELNESLGRGESCVVYTSRKLITGESDAENLSIVRKLRKR